MRKIIYVMVLELSRTHFDNMIARFGEVRMSSLIQALWRLRLCGRTLITCVAALLDLGSWTLPLVRRGTNGLPIIYVKATGATQRIQLLVIT